MNVLFRLLRLLAISVIRAILALFIAIVRFLVLPFLLVIFGVLGRLVFTSFTATINGPGEYIDRLASEWTAWILSLGIDRGSIDRIYSLCRFLVASRIILGWTVATLFTGLILQFVINFFI